MNSSDKVGEQKRKLCSWGAGIGRDKGVNKQMTYRQNLNVIALVLQIATEIL